ncbi:hypothetical protein [uncultured Lamprocystis sp.]|uniref:hypothetical protein n=1 Tax=uncultured Lamprocystis sp. TaxID=543132 RepID=UPI0025DDA3D5|nr:hypothetical protein [uncultured Lamprocystis sp.]
MTLRFHESLGRLVAEVEAAGVPLDDATVFVRDGEGRLMVARESLSGAQALAASLSKTLGAYASTRPVIDGRMAAALVKDQAASEISVVLPDRPAEGPRIIRMVDRRVSPFTDGSVDVVPVVGRVTDQHPETMLAKLSRAHGEDAGSHGPISFTHQVREMVDRFAARAQYDVILIDARAGLAESSAPALLALGAEILFFGADQPQTFLSYRYLFAHLLHCFGTGPGGYRDWRGHLSFVQAKAPSSAQQRIDFRDRLHGLCAEFLYDKESLAADGSVQVADFNSGADGGRLEPHQ